ncbi:MAG: hypothetical protein ABJD97_08195, partial [Betaproteobacteria bacterium]
TLNAVPGRVDEVPARPWWRFPFVWLVVGLPAGAVVAAIASGILAVRHADPVVDEYQAGLRQAADEPIERGAAHGSMEPAERARNHAATPKH